jgi:hypothetical protein
MPVRTAPRRISQPEVFMNKVLGLIILLGAAMGLSPDLGAQITAPLHDGVERAVGISRPLLQPILDPAFRMSTRNELTVMARQLRRRNETGQALPNPRAFQQFLTESALSGRGGQDPWGGEYYMVLHRDSVVIGSPGPDGIRGTADDLTEGFPLRKR